MDHISDHDLERFYLGMVQDEEELASIEEHLLWCCSCMERVGQVALYVDTIRGAIIGNLDLSLPGY